MNTALFDAVPTRRRLVGAAVSLAVAGTVCAGVAPVATARSHAIMCPMGVSARDTYTATGAVALKPCTTRGPLKY